MLKQITHRLDNLEIQNRGRSTYRGSPSFTPRNRGHTRGRFGSYPRRNESSESSDPEESEEEEFEEDDANEADVPRRSSRVRQKPKWLTSGEFITKSNVTVQKDWTEKADFILNFIQSTRKATISKDTTDFVIKYVLNN